MKYKERTLALILSVVMVLTFMPALAFADDGTAAGAAQAGNTAESKAVAARQSSPVAAKASAAKLTSVEFTSEDDCTGYVGTTSADIEVKGATIKLTYSNGKTVTYKYMIDESEEGLFDDGWYLNGNTNDDREDLDYYIDTHGALKEGNNECELSFWDDAVYDYRGGCKINVVGIIDEDIISVSYDHVSGKPLEGRANTWEKKYEYFWDTDDYEDEFYDEYRDLVGDKLTIERRTSDEVYNEETDEWEEVYGTETEVYTCQKYTDEDGNTSYAFISEPYVDEEYGETYYDKEDPVFTDDQIPGEWTWAGLEQGEVSVSYNGVVADQKLYVNVPAVKLMKSAELKLAEGFEPKVSVGQDDWIDADTFYGEGNEFIVYYTDNTSTTYTYDPERWAFADKDGNEAYFSAELSEQGITLEKGIPTDVKFSHWYNGDDDEFYDTVDFNFTVTAKKSRVYVKDSSYQYTGKVIKPKIVVKTYYGDTTVPSSAYKYTAPKYKAIDNYSFPIKILDTDNYFALDSDDSAEVWAWYSIIPKKISKLTKVVKGKKSFTAKWKKLSKKDQKVITGLIIEYATKSNFSNSKYKKVKKSASSATIKKLKGNQKYYVRIYTYKTKKFTYYDDNGKKRTAKYEIWSKPSAKKSVKTKK